MNESIKAAHLTHDAAPQADITPYSAEAAARVEAFHRTLPTYEPTPLADLRHLARSLGLARVAVKDESKRFGLNAFKGLGTSYAVARYLAQYLGIPEEEMTYERLRAPENRERLRGVTLVTATDGNHGRGIAWAAKLFGIFAHVFMPKGGSPERLANIRGLGAEASFTTYNYDDTVRYASQMAQEKGWVLMQDTAFGGYTERPQWIMQGYSTLAHEAMEHADAYLFAGRRRVAAGCDHGVLCRALWGGASRHHHRRAESRRLHLSDGGGERRGIAHRDGGD